MRYLRTNTATRVTVGPFFDKTDGVTPETALTVTGIKLTFMVDTGGVPTLILDTNPTASAGANDMVHVTGDDAGFYDLELAAADVNYLGRAMLALTDAANHCPVFHEFMIIPAMIYDSVFLGSDRLDVNVTHVGDTAQTARDIGASVNQTGDSYARLGAPAGASHAADVASVKADTGTTIPAALTTIDDYVDTEIAAMPASVWAYTVEGAYTAVQYLRLAIAALAGKLSGAATTTVTIRNTGDSKDRITATVDADGNRSAVTLDGT